jgi:hypothetical protein
MVTMMVLPPGPLPPGGASVGVTQSVGFVVVEQADRIVSATPAQIIPVSIFICFLSLCEQASRSRVNPAGRESGGALGVA